MTGDLHGVLGRYAPSAVDDEAVDVQLLNFPLQVFVQAREHHDELIREFALLALSPPQDRPGRHVPARLLELVQSLGRDYAGVGDRTDAVRDSALERGELAIDLVYQVPPSAGPALQQLRTLMDDAEQFCLDEQLLTLAATPLERRFRQWYLDEFARQLAGGPPTPWAGPLNGDG